MAASRSLNGAIAGGIAAAVWAAQQPLDKRVFGSDYDDLAILALEVQLAAGRPEDAHDAAAGCRLAAARLADQTERLAGANREVDPVDGPDLPDRPTEQAAPDREVHAQGADVQERGLGHVAATGSA